jgi:hypothetical protein
VNFRKWVLCEIWIVLSLHLCSFVPVLSRTNTTPQDAEPWPTQPAVKSTSEIVPATLFNSASLFDHPTGQTQTSSVTDTEVIGRGFATRENGRSRVFQTGGDELSWRLRRLTRRDYMLAGPEAPRLVIWDEDYQDSRDQGWGAESNFQQGRSFAGFSWRSAANDRLRLELGYLTQTWDEPGPDDRRFHFFSLNFYY